jgi:hypothetical protein
MSMAPQSLMALLNATQQPLANGPLSQDPTAEARARQSGQTRTDANQNPPRMTGRAQAAGRGAGVQQMALQSLVGNGGDGSYDTGISPELESPNGPIPGGHISDAAGTIKGNQPATPWTVNVQRGIGPNAESEDTTFQKGEAPQITEHGTPNEELAQKNAVGLAQAQHPQKGAGTDFSTQDRVKIAQMFFNLANERRQAWAKDLTHDPNEPNPDEDNITKLEDEGRGYIANASNQSSPTTTNTTQNGPAGQTTSATTIQPTASKGQLADPKIAQQYLQQAGGDPDKARQLAKQDGWSF